MKVLDVFVSRTSYVAPNFFPSLARHRSATGRCRDGALESGGGLLVGGLCVVDDLSLPPPPLLYIFVVWAGSRRKAQLGLLGRLP